jgi:hypothetical protein
LRGRETKHSFGGVEFFGFNKQSSGYDIRRCLKNPFVNIYVGVQMYAYIADAFVAKIFEMALCCNA